MKKLFLISLLVCVGILQSLADDFGYTDGSGMTWYCSEIDSTSVYIYTPAVYQDEMVIPEKVYNGTKEYTVTSIQFTFHDNKTLEKVTWPSTVTEIPYGMFRDCSSLKTVENIRKVTSIDGYAFNGCNNLIELDLGSCKIAGFAFYGCSELQSIGDFAKCTSVDDYAFCGCSSLEKVDLSMCTSVGSYAFDGCSSLQPIGNPKLTSIQECAFRSCSSLEKIDLSLCTSVESEAFRGCTNLHSVGNPKLASISGNAFYGCSSLENIDLSMCTSVGYTAFQFCSSLEKIDLSMCTSLGSYAFDGCKKLENVIGLENFKSIPEGAFRETALKFVNLPKVESIGNNAFMLTGITKISLPETLKSMGYQCFDNVKEYTFNGMQPAVLYEDNGFSAFSGASYIIRVPESAVDAYKTADIWKNYKDKIFSISDQFDYDVTTTAMDNQSGLEQAIGATNMKKVFSLKATGTINGYDIFMIRTKMTNLQNLDLTDADIVANGFAYYENNSTTDNVVGDNSFCELDNLVTLKLPKNAVSIGNYAVGNCSSLESVDFPKNLKNIEDFSFKGCSKLDNVVLPDGLESIGDNSFRFCI